MDIFLHIVVNATIANQLSQDGNSKRALILGGIAPDMDVFFAWIPILIPQLFMLQHRGLFHTVLAAPFIIIPLILSTKYYARVNFIERSSLIPVRGAPQHSSLRGQSTLFAPVTSTRLSKIVGATGSSNWVTRLGRRAWHP